MSQTSYQFKELERKEGKPKMRKEGGGVQKICLASQRSSQRGSAAHNFSPYEHSVHESACLAAFCPLLTPHGHRAVSPVWSISKITVKHQQLMQRSLRDLASRRSRFVALVDVFPVCPDLRQSNQATFPRLPKDLLCCIMSGFGTQTPAGLCDHINKTLRRVIEKAFDL